MITVLDKETIARRAPAAFGHPAAHMSARYGFVKTESVIDSMKALGFHPTDAQQDRPNRRDPLTVRHSIQFTPEIALDKSVKTVGDAVPRITFVNSHNGRTKARFFAGFFRLVCLNGLTVGTPDAVAEMFHREHVMEDVEEALTLVTETINRRTESIERWQEIQMPHEEKVQFAASARELRFKDRAEAYRDDNVLEFRRFEDKGDDLWRVYNVVQENLVSRSLDGISAAGRRIHSRPLSSISANIRLNQGLWNLAEETALRLAA